jgi:uncharacterized protein (TIGR02147 family)
MKKTIFEYSNYKSYLRDLLKSRPRNGYGFKSEIAKALDCRPAFISQVLNNQMQFSPEQAEAFNQFAGHSKDESVFFLLLVQYDRAGSKSLSERIKFQINEFLQKRLILKDRVDIKKTLSAVDQAIYYSSWYYAAVHMLVTIPQYQNKEAIVKYLGLSLDKVNDILEFLISSGLILRANGSLRPGISRIFLGLDSPMIVQHHKNWRLKAIDAFDNDLKRDLHLSTVVTVNRSDAEKIKQKLVQYIEEIRQQIKESQNEEELHCFSVDFFNVR